jgi:glycine/D-amino acid oxidase-like deaminating enzyme
MFTTCAYVYNNICSSLVVGGTCQENDWSTAESLEDTKSIMDGVCEVFPSLRTAKVLGTYVGLRPCRPSVRLDSEELMEGGASSVPTTSVGVQVPSRGDRQQQQKQLLVRCYGLGGSGWTIGPGMAHDVLENHVRPHVDRIQQQQQNKRVMSRL